MREILPNLYSFSITLPNSPLKQINSYVIKGPERNVLFDTAYNLPQCQEALLAGLAELDLKIEDMDLVLTHLHADHTGLTHLFSDAGCRIYANLIDATYANGMVSGKYWHLMDSFRLLYGMHEDELQIMDNPGYRYQLAHPFDYIPLNIGEKFSVGDYHFEILDLMGHTPGHIGLYDQDKQIIFSADTVLDPMTPNITYWGAQYPSILGAYLNTLRRLKSLPLKLMFATHRKIIDSPKQRMDQIIQHHYERMQEILDAMEIGQAYTIRDISAKISWRIKAESWEDFPKNQKWFAAGETMAHAEYLANLSYLELTKVSGTLYFKKVRQQIDLADFA